MVKILPPFALFYIVLLSSLPAGADISFNYDPSSDIGPPYWDDIKVKGSEYFEYIKIKKNRKNQCGGSDQSPVELRPNSDCKDDHQIMTKRGHHDFDTIDFVILPHSLRTNLHVAKDVTKGARADFSNLSRFEPAIHVDVKIPSEHYLEKTQYKGEFQITHFDENKNRFIIISIFMDDSSDEHNVQLEEFIREWEEISWKKDHECYIERNITSTTYTRTHKRRSKREMNQIWGKLEQPRFADWDLYLFLTTPWYCGYDGSLTVPPCSRRVSWRILDLPMKMSKSQYQRMSQLLLEQLDENCELGTVAYNGTVNRPLQKNKNKIWCCTRKDWKPKKHWRKHKFPDDYSSWKK